MPSLQHAPVQRLLVVCPFRIGDAVLATPTLRALRTLYSDAQITALVRDTVRPILDATPWVDRFVTLRPRRKGMPADGRRTGVFTIARRLSMRKFDCAVVLPNGFASALVVRMAGVPRRVGYDRGARGGLLTDRLLPRRRIGKLVPVPMRDVYLGIAQYLGAQAPDPSIQLFTRARHDERAAALLRSLGVEPGRDPLVLLNCAASPGDARLWYPERFADVAGFCTRQLGAKVALLGSQRHRPVLDKVLAAATTPVIDLPAQGLTVPLLKSVVRLSSLVVSHDDGARHIAAAFGVPVVTVFGPTDPAWSDNGSTAERRVLVDVFCGPCHKRKCPLDHRCMTLVDPAMVTQHVRELWDASRQPSAVSPQL